MNGGQAAVKSKLACMECKRKKTKCDMRIPHCSLCMKADTECAYPSGRKPRRPRTTAQTQSSGDRHNRLSNSHESECTPSARGENHFSPHSDNHNSNAPELILSPSFQQQLELDLPESLNVTNTVRTERASSDLFTIPASFRPGQATPSTLISYQNITDITQKGDSSHRQSSGNILDGSLLVETSLVPDDGADFNISYSANAEPFEFTPSLNPGFDDLFPMDVSIQISKSPSSENHSHTFSLCLPVDVVKEVIDVYFQAVQHYIPLFHKPRFYAKYVLPYSSNHQYDCLAAEDAFLLNGVLGLAARFSPSTYFAGTEPTERGDRFVNKAKAIYDESITKLSTPTLTYMQGCILLAYNLYAITPSFQAWLVIGSCSNLASALGIDSIDAEKGDFKQTRDSTILSWSEKEESRRAWWSLWELDCFAIAVAGWPHSVGNARHEVMLPVSDEAWFADTEVPSAIVDPNPANIWRTLKGCPNQDERAWFLVGNYILFLVHDLQLQKNASESDVKAVETALTCYLLLLPSNFGLTSGFTFAKGEFKKNNVMISTIIMAQGSRIYLRILYQKLSLNSAHSPDNHFICSLPASVRVDSGILDCQPYTQQVISAIHKWPAEYIGMNSPWIGCLVIGAAAMNLRVTKYWESGDSDRSMENAPTSSEAELLKLVIEQIARYWKFGSILLDTIKALESGVMIPNLIYK